MIFTHTLQITMCIEGAKIKAFDFKCPKQISYSLKYTLQ